MFAARSAAEGANESAYCSISLSSTWGIVILQLPSSDFAYSSEEGIAATYTWTALSLSSKANSVNENDVSVTVSSASVLPEEVSFTLTKYIPAPSTFSQTA